MISKAFVFVYTFARLLKDTISTKIRISCKDFGMRDLRVAYVEFRVLINS